MSNMGSSTSYRKDPKETTEWDDIQRKLGNLPPLEEPERVEEEDVPEPTREEVLASKTEEELDELEDDDEFADDRFMAEYRRKRMAELTSKMAKNKFGDIIEISRPDFVTEVTEASKAGEGTWVVVFLHQEHVIGSRIVDRLLPAVAAKCKATKFIKMIATQCIENYPDRNVPTLLCYYKGELGTRLVGLGTMGGRETTADILEWILYNAGAVETELDEDPREASKW